MSKIISVWSRKGGVGKSTLALNIAAAAKARELSVLLVDTDKQGSCSWLAEFKQLPFKVVNKIPINSEYDVIIVDYPPSLETVPHGDVVIVPYAPSALDIGAVKRFIPNLKAKGKTVVEVINKVHVNRSEGREFAKVKQSEGVLLVNDRSIYVRAAAKAATIYDDQFKTAYGIKAAKKEINAILDEVMK